MKLSDFTEAKSGRFVTAPEGHQAFVPDPLPPRFSWDDDLVSALAAAVDAVARLEQAALKLASPMLISGISQAFLKKEAQLSARIEGTQTLLADLFQEATTAGSGSENTNVKEVLNHIETLRYGLRRQSELPISKRLMQELHTRLLVGDVRGKDKSPGDFRRSSNVIGAPGATIEEATFVPPPPKEMMECLNQLEEYIHAPTKLHPFIQAACVHYQFEAIHPFMDGNGRIGRLLIILMLCAQQALSSPLIYMSAYFDRTRDEYIRRLYEVSCAGRWEAWLKYFLHGVEVQTKEAFDRCQKLAHLHSDYDSRLVTPGAPAKLLTLIEYLFQYPFLSIGDVSRLLETDFHTARRYIDRLAQEKIVVELTGKKRNRVFHAHEIFAVFNE